ncbi:MAG: hypothetical protein PF636_11545, partial [Actinomycetota bacterium]|nr:hypothetical protein [Actinomycetota bacterium]
FHYLPCLYAAYTLLDRDRRLESASMMLERYAFELDRYRTYLSKNQPKKELVVKSRHSGPVGIIGRSYRDEPFITT